MISEYHLECNNERRSIEHNHGPAGAPVFSHRWTGRSVPSDPSFRSLWDTGLCPVSVKELRVLGAQWPSTVILPILSHTPYPLSYPAAGLKILFPRRDNTGQILEIVCEPRFPFPFAVADSVFLYYADLFFSGTYLHFLYTALYLFYRTQLFAFSD